MIFYDFEVFKYDWLVIFKDIESKKTTTIVNDSDQLKGFYEKHKQRIFVGFNCRGYDQYIFKAILCDLNPYDLSKFIIEDGRKGWEYDSQFGRMQLINFDIMVGFHGLKQLEAFMGNNIKETTVPFDIQRELTDQEIEEVIQYCDHDVEQTMLVFLERQEEFYSHLSLIKAFNMPLKNLNKTKAQLSAMILDARLTNRNDEFNISIPNTLKIKKYQHIVDWYKNPANMDYSQKLVVDVAGCEHVFAWGGIHGALPNYTGHGVYLNMDVASLYPAIMIEYGYISRSVRDPNKYRQIRDKRLELKRKKDPVQLPYKIVLNSTYGAMKDAYNPLYDPLMANNVCVAGQLLLLDLIEQLEDHCQLIQSNTDGLFIKLQSADEIDKIKAICKEWEQRTRLELEFETFDRIYQKDVNNYIVIESDGKYKSKGAYVKKLNKLDNDLPIVNKALINYFANNIPVEETIMSCRNLIEFQKVVKVSNKYKAAYHGMDQLNEKVIRVFASKDASDPGIFKVKKCGRVEKMANTPAHAFIVNDDITTRRIPRKLDRQYYIDVANKRILDFIEGR